MTYPHAKRTPMLIVDDPVGDYYRDHLDHLERMMDTRETLPATTVDLPPRHSMSSRSAALGVQATAWPTDPVSGRRLMTPKVVDYDLTGAPPVIRLLADGVRAMTPEEIKAEAINQWPREFPVIVDPAFPTPKVHLEWVGACGIITVADAEEDGHPEDPYRVGDIDDCVMCEDENCQAKVRIRTGFWLDTDLERARNKLLGYVVGVALGVTKVENPPVSDTVKAAANLDNDIRGRQRRDIQRKRDLAERKAKRVESARAKAKSARKARKAGR